MNACAHQPGNNLAEFEGTLIADGQHRMLPTDQEGHMVPVLVLDVRLANVTHNHLRVEQPFPPGKDSACIAAARRYRKGMQVRVQAPIACLTLKASHATHIHLVQADQPTPTTTEETTV